MDRCELLKPRRGKEKNKVGRYHPLVVCPYVRAHVIRQFPRPVDDTIVRIQCRIRKMLRVSERAWPLLWTRARAPAFIGYLLDRAFGAVTRERRPAG